MKANIISQFKLPAYIKGKTFADASKAIEKKFSDRTDPASSETKEELLTRLSKAQEYIKMQEALKANSSEIPDQMNGEIPAGMEEFMGQNQAANGLNLGETFAINPEAQAALGNVPGGPDLGAQMATPQVPGVGGMDLAGGAQSLLSAGQDIFGKTGISTAGGQKYDAASTKKSNMSNTVGGVVELGKGIATGNPIDMIKGGAKVLGSVIGGGREVRDMERANATANIADSAKLRQSDFANGGKMTQNKYAGGTPNLSEIFKINPQAQQQLESDSGYSNPTAGNTMFKPENVSANKERSGTEKAVRGGAEWLGENAGNIAQYAPIVGNLTSKINRPTTAVGSRVGGVYQPDYFDNNSLINQVNQQNMERSLTESSGGDLGALRSNLIGAGAAKLKAQSDANIQGDQIDRGENRAAFQAERQKSMSNTQLDERFLERAAKDKGAYESAKDAKRAALYEDFGKIGREEVDKKLVRDMFGYTWDGKYYIDKKGNKYSSKDVKAKIAEDVDKDKEDTKTARLYKNKNSKVNSELNFRIPSDTKLT